MAAILDPEQTVHWTSGLERFEIVSCRPGEVGSKAWLHLREGGRAHVTQDTLLEADPVRRYVSQARGDALSARIGTTHPHGQARARRRSAPQRSLDRGCKPLFLCLLQPLMR